MGVNDDTSDESLTDRGQLSVAAASQAGKVEDDLFIPLDLDVDEPAADWHRIEEIEDGLEGHRTARLASPDASDLLALTADEYGELKRAIQRGCYRAVGATSPVCLVNRGRAI